MKIKLDIPLKVSEICRVLKAEFPNSTNSDFLIDTICTDTRECSKNDLFIALEGERESGEKYVTDALNKGCYVISKSSGIGIISVKDTSDALLKISAAYKSVIAPKYTVAVTGSVGKSTTVRFISAILKEKYHVHSTIGNFNNHIGVPITLLSMPKNTDVLVTELGMNHKKEISRLSKTVKPDIGVITAIGTSHIGNLGSRSEIAKAKLEILDGIHKKKLLIPYGEPLLSERCAGLSVGRNSSLSDYSLDDMGNERYSFRSINKRLDNIAFFDKREHLLSDLAFAVTVAKILGLSDNEILKGIHAITEADLRQRFIVLNGFTIFDDSYNASLESIRADLEFISSLGKPTGAFLGDVLELGDNTRLIHEQIGAAVADANIDHLYLYGTCSEDIANGAVKHGMSHDNIYINTDLSSPQISVAQIMENHESGEIILFKASHKLRFDKIADFIKNEERKYNDRY